MKRLTVLAATVIAATMFAPPMDARAAVKFVYGGTGCVSNGQNSSLNHLMDQIKGICQENDNGSVPMLPSIPNQPSVPMLPIIPIQPNLPVPPTPEQPSTPEAPETDNPGQEFIEEVVRLVNAEREKAGATPLSINHSAQSAAAVRAKEIETQFSHTRPNGSDFNTALKEAGVSYTGAGENIAWGQKTPAAVMDSWMNSSGHRANILNPNYTSIGVGHYVNGGGNQYWTQLFLQ